MLEICLGCKEDKKLYQTRGRLCRKCARNKNPKTKLKELEYGRNRKYKKYGITKEIFAELLFLQNNACAICGITFNSISKERLGIDHCHVTGKIRGILCDSCNIGLGKFKDDIDFLAKAIIYLKNSK